MLSDVLLISSHIPPMCPPLSFSYLPPFCHSFPPSPSYFPPPFSNPPSPPFSNPPSPPFSNPPSPPFSLPPLYPSTQLLDQAGISCTNIYSSLDQTARKINVAKFVNKKVMTLLVTDVAVGTYINCMTSSLHHVM